MVDKPGTQPLPAEPPSSGELKIWAEDSSLYQCWLGAGGGGMEASRVPCSSSLLTHTLGFLPDQSAGDWT